MTPARSGRRNTFATPALPDDFVDFVHELNAHDVEYLLVGGYAVGVHGHIRATVDIDFLYRPSTANVERLVRALRAFGAPASVIDPAHLLQPGNMAAFGSPPTRIDILASIDGVTFDQAAAGRVVVDIGGELLPVIGLDALRVNKRASGRSKDLEDVKALSRPQKSRPEKASRKPKP